MTRVDQFESVFKAAAKTIYAHEPLAIRSILVLTDLDRPAAEAFGKRVRSFVDSLGAGAPEQRWRVVQGDAFDTVARMLEIIKDTGPDLICTYRSLHSDAWRWSYALGSYVGVLAQETTVPVLLLPNPHAEKEAPESFPHGRPTWGEDPTPEVMAITNHLAGDHRLVNYAVAFTPEGGKLVLAHVEDGTVFDRYVDVISKIPAIDTDSARETIEGQLLKEPHDYIRSCVETLEAAGVSLRIEEVVAMGHRLSEHLRLIEEHEIDLLLMHTRDEDQLAMHGLAYPIAVELRHLPILML